MIKRLPPLSAWRHATSTAGDHWFWTGPKGEVYVIQPDNFGGARRFAGLIKFESGNVTHMGGGATPQAVHKILASRAGARPGRGNRRFAEALGKLARQPGPVFPHQGGDFMADFVAEWEADQAREARQVDLKKRLAQARKRNPTPEQHAVFAAKEFTKLKHAMAYGQEALAGSVGHWRSAIPTAIAKIDEAMALLEREASHAEIRSYEPGNEWLPRVLDEARSLTVALGRRLGARMNPAGRKRNPAAAKAEPSAEAMAVAQAVQEDPAVTKARSALTLFRRRDMGYAEARMIARGMINDLAVEMAAAWPKKLSGAWLAKKLDQRKYQRITMTDLFAEWAKLTAAGMDARRPA